MSKPRKKPARKPEPEEPVETLQHFKARMLEQSRVEANARFDATFVPRARKDEP